MSIGSAINISASGLRTTQNDLNVVAGNIANVETPGFTRKTLVQTEITAAGQTIGVRGQVVERVLNEQVQAQLRDLAAVNVGNQIQADFLSRLDVAFGEPGSPTAIDTSFNTALATLEELSATPESFSAQNQAVADLRVFTGQLNALSNTIQDLRREADLQIAAVTTQANELLEGIEDINQRIVNSTAAQANQASLLDERDRFIDELSQIVDVVVDDLPNNGVQIRTVGGVTLFSTQAFQFEFTSAGTVAPETTLENGALSTVQLSDGSSNFVIDLLSPNQLRDGALAAYTELRDVTLVQAQAQLDELAAQISLAVSNTTVQSTAVGTPPADGLSVDISGIQDGNTVSLAFTDNTGTARTVTLVQVSDASQLPVDNSFTADPNDVVVGLDFATATGASIETALDAAVPGFTLDVALAGGSLDFTAASGATTDTLSASITNTALTGDGLPFALFQDGGTGGTFTNALGSGPGLVGFAGRIEVSSAVVSDPSLISRFSATNTAAGDSARVDFILEQIRGDVRTYSPSTGLGAPSNPIKATAADFLQTIISSQGQRASNAERDADASQVSFNNVQERFQAESAVNIDVELARLIELEQAFQANARV
ncbi:MAG: flagellar hook-associated protein FlgK, partial [Pseudomonadota bacterium]